MSVNDLLLETLNIHVCLEYFFIISPDQVLCAVLLHIIIVSDLVLDQ